MAGLSHLIASYLNPAIPLFSIPTGPDYTDHTLDGLEAPNLDVSDRNQSFVPPPLYIIVTMNSKIKVDGKAVKVESVWQQGVGRIMR